MLRSRENTYFNKTLASPWEQSVPFLLSIFFCAPIWQSLCKKKAFDLTVKYNDDVFVNHKTKFCLLNSINILHEQTKLPSALFHVLYLKFNTNGHRSTKLLEKRDNFNFVFLNYLQLDRNEPTTPENGVSVFQLVRYARSCSL